MPERGKTKVTIYLVRLGLELERVTGLKEGLNLRNPILEGELASRIKIARAKRISPYPGTSFRLQDCQQSCVEKLPLIDDTSCDVLSIAKIGESVSLLALVALCDFLVVRLVNCRRVTFLLQTEDLALVTILYKK